MPYKTKGLQREYCRKWMAARRATWFVGKSCKVCGSGEKLEIHHRDPSQKISHVVWSWKKERMEIELAKCDVLCHFHHQQETATYLGRMWEGRPNLTCRKFSDSQVESIRDRAKTESYRNIARSMGVTHSSISDLMLGKTYRSPGGSGFYRNQISTTIPYAINRIIQKLGGHPE